MSRFVVGVVAFLLGWLAGSGPWRAGRVIARRWEDWRFRRRFPVGCTVRINGRCCERKHAGAVVRVARHQLDADRPEARFDLGVEDPWGCCARGMERVS